jgi:hypothetical protein
MTRRTVTALTRRTRMAARPTVALVAREGRLATIGHDTVAVVLIRGTRADRARPFVAWAKSSVRKLALVPAVAARVRAVHDVGLAAVDLVRVAVAPRPHARSNGARLIGTNGDRVRRRTRRAIRGSAPGRRVIDAHAGLAAQFLTGVAHGRTRGDADRRCHRGAARRHGRCGSGPTNASVPADPAPACAAAAPLRGRIVAACGGGGGQEN